MKPGKTRADVALVDRGLVESRAKAQALLMAGQVFSKEARITKAGQMIGDDQPLRCAASPIHGFPGVG
ncbi:hypothetical protein JCM17846_13320 [Iodidimonas nitroreducens]|uniref:RNA-binding S4 domain-containing protein n=1 Tax=Iodidimonas nitroreducens TaxID=1236968 RepID=A0A5A7N8C9_9PROT|nr:hypothetical protein [Iodidimonas nitroreducens]GER03650.1 hypothetical protein JCM17846_13320 [Iodidimonas nitroreducens]